MKLFNTLTRSIEPIVPLQAPTVTIYTCGPTVYDYPHVGNWYTYIRQDILIRTLGLSGFQPKWVMNITDVGHLVSDADDGEDKLEKGAKREGKTAWDVAKFYTEYFTRGLDRLAITKPTFMPKATEHIAEQIALIEQLEIKGYTYIIADGVYYDTNKFPSYATFASLDLDEQQAGARVTVNPAKRNASDFAVWKFSPTDHKRDMEWKSPWGIGFPGWHIECSAMSMKYLGKTLDIHAGGIDHIPVHHSNEIAQSEAATGKIFATHWMHTNHITIDGEKIAKSLGNSITLEDIEARGIQLDALRLHVLESHYRSQSKFSWDSLQAAQNRLYDLRALAALQWQALKLSYDSTAFAVGDVKRELQACLENDLDTPQALAYLSNVSKQFQTILIDEPMLGRFQNMLRAIDVALGLHLADEVDITSAQKNVLTTRETAREAKDWQHSDELRDQLIAEGIGLRDTAYGAIWYRIQS